MIIKFWLETKERNYHVYMLKKYYAREEKTENENEKEDLKVTASSEVLFEEKILSIDEELLLKLGMYRQNESVSDVRLRTELNDSQSKVTKIFFGCAREDKED